MIVSLSTGNSFIFLKDISSVFMFICVQAHFHHFLKVVIKNLFTVGQESTWQP